MDQPIDEILQTGTLQTPARTALNYLSPADKRNANEKRPNTYALIIQIQ